MPGDSREEIDGTQSRYWANGHDARPWSDPVRLWNQDTADSAPQACKDFRSWWLAQGGNVVAGKDKTLLARAVDEAPSGHIYRDMSTLESNVSSAVAAQGTSLGISEKTITSETALSVAQDCQSVNISS